MVLRNEIGSGKEKIELVDVVVVGRQDVVGGGRDSEEVGRPQGRHRDHRRQLGRHRE